MSGGDTETETARQQDRSEAEATPRQPDSCCCLAARRPARRGDTKAATIRMDQPWKAGEKKREVKVEEKVVVKG